MEQRYEVKSKKYNNPYNIDSDKAIEIWSMGNGDLLQRMKLEHSNWKNNEKRKKHDPEINSLLEQQKKFKKSVENHPEMVKLKERHDQELKLLQDTNDEINDLLVSIATLDSELANERSEYNRDNKEFKGLFSLCLDEVKRRVEYGEMEQ